MTLVSVTLTRHFTHRWWPSPTCEPSRTFALDRKQPNHGEEVDGRKRTLNTCRPARIARKSAKKGRTEFLLCVETTSDMRSLHIQTGTDPWAEIPAEISQHHEDHELHLVRQDHQLRTEHRHLLVAQENVEEQLHHGVRSVADKGQRPLRADGPEAVSAKVTPEVHIGQTQADSSTVSHHVAKNLLEAQVLHGWRQEPGNIMNSRLRTDITVRATISSLITGTIHAEHLLNMSKGIRYPMRGGLETLLVPGLT